jgi:Flp pilus assembly protein TadD
MMGGIVLLAIGATVFAALWALGLPRSLWSFAGAALMLGAAGYALQARPGLAGAPVEAAKKARPDDPMLRDLRSAMFGRFTADDSYFFAADALIRGGDPERAAKFMLGGVRASPNDAALWTWLGVVLTEADGRTVSPAAGVAFRRAIALAPQHPGPRFFYGLAHVRSGQFAAARPLWAAALKLTPPGASYRNDIAMRLTLLDRFLELQATEQQRPSAN